MSSAIEQCFDEKYGIAKKKAETRQRYLARVVEKAYNASDDEWERLTGDAQRWFNTASKPWEDKQTIPDFPDVDDDDQSEQGEADERDQGADDTREAGEGDDDMAARKKRAAKRGTARKAAAPAKKVVHAGSNGKLADSGSSHLKRAMLKDMGLTSKELAKVVKAKGFPLSPVRIDIVRADFRHSIRLLQEEGKLKDKYDF